MHYPAALSAFALAFCLSAHAGTIVGRVVAVADGDTLTILDAEQRQHIVRLDGIDAPEKGQPFGQASKRRISDLAFGRIATADCGKVDRYRRNVCSVVVDGNDPGAELLRSGLAWVFTRYVHELPAQRRADYRQAELQAQQGGVGLWGDADLMPPWEWRRQGKPFVSPR